MSRIPEFAGRYISIPYVEVNCWGLMQKVYATEYGIAVGDMSEQHHKLREHDWVDVLKDGLIPREGDIILFKSGEYHKHVGLILNAELMLHTTKGSNSCIERWTTSIWEKCVISIYRHKTRCNS